MKTHSKIIILTLLALCFQSTYSLLNAEGYQVNTLSTRQFGMGHVGTGMKLNSESVWFNPAAMSFQKSKFDFSAGISGIFSKAKYSSISYTDTHIEANSDNKMSTPFYLYANWKPNKDLAVGLSVNTPFGSSMKWPDNWAGAQLIQEISLASYQIQPAISYKLFNGHLSIGAGLSFTFGSFSLSRSMLPVGSVTNNTIAAMLSASGMGQYAGAITAVGDNPLVSAKLKSDSKVSVGVNLGIMYDINEQWSIGMTYRSRVKMKVTKGTAELNFANNDVKQILGATGLIPKLDEGTFSTSLPLPAVVSLGASFRPYKNWEFAMDMQWVGWHAYKNLNVSFNEKELAIEDINSVKNYKNTIITRIGLKYEPVDWFTFRTGMYVDESPVRSSHMNPETPSMTKLAFLGGLSFMPGKTRRLGINLSYGYIRPADPERAGSYPYNNALKGGKQEPFAGNYKVSAHTLSVGFNFSF